MRPPRAVEIDARRPYLGSPDQLFRLESSTVDDGPGRGSRRIRVVTGGGLDVEVLPDRCLDLGHASVDGVPLAWVSRAGFRGHAQHAPTGHGWLDTFGGGLLATCGLDAVGSPSEDEDGAHGLHGDIGSRPARVTTVARQGDTLVVAGIVSQGRVFGAGLELSRRLEFELGGTRIDIHDTVTNTGAGTAAMMLLHHINLGWPLVAPGAELRTASPGKRIRGAAEPDDSISPPSATWTERVVRYRAATTTLSHRDLGLEVAITPDAETLPWLYAWRQFGVQDYVLGLEPSTSGVLDGRAAARAAHDLVLLTPGQSREHHVRIDVRRIAPTSDAPG
jgi:hypothetical protein